MIKRKKLVLFVAVSFLLLTIAVFYASNHSHTNDLSQGASQINYDFDNAYNDLDEMLVTYSFILEPRHNAGCHYATPNSGLKGILCDSSQNGYIHATNAQMSNWPTMARQIDSYLASREWQSPKGGRGDVTYVKIDRLFQESAFGPVITIYEKYYEHGIVCKLAFTANKEYPYNSPTKMYVSEQCTKGL